MSYEKAIELAGAEILACEYFGSYQGDWYAKVKYNGKVGWVVGSYGSCTGCDAFQAEFGWDTHKHIDNMYYDPIDYGFKDGCEECDILKKRLIAFGKVYLDDMITQDEAEQQALKNSWDMSCEEIIAYLKANKIE